MSIAPENVKSYAAMMYRGDPTEQAYKDAKYAYDRALAEDVSDDIRTMLREELDMAAEACADVWRMYEREGYEHYR